MRVKLDINSVAVKQLESAIWMYAYDYDEVAVHTIAGAAFEIYTKRLGVSSFMDDMREQIKPEKIKDFISLINKPYNFFKHGEHRYEKLEYIEYEEDSVEMIIYLSAEANLIGDERYRLSCSSIYRFFYVLKNPELFNMGKYKDEYLRKVADLGLNPEDIKTKNTLRVWLGSIGNTFLNGTDSPFRNIKPN